MNSDIFIDTFGVFFGILFLVIGFMSIILPILLLFKIWKMTDDIKRIAKNVNDIEHNVYMIGKEIVKKESKE